MIRRRRQIRLRTWTLVVYVAASAGLLAVHLSWFDGFLGMDFLDPLLAARVLHSGSHCIYCLPAQNQAAIQYVHASLVSLGRSDPNSTFVDPPLVAFILQPLTNLDPAVAIGLLSGASLACAIAAIVIVALRVVEPDAHLAVRLLIAAAIALSIPVANALQQGQWDLILLLPVVLAVISTEERPFVAGLLLSLVLVKPQLVWLTPMVLIGARQWRCLAGFLSGSLVWAISTVAILGAAHINSWMSAIESAAGEVGTTLGLPGFVSSLGVSVNGLAIGAVVAATVLAAAVQFGSGLRRRGDIAICVGIALSVSLAPHVFEYDMALLLAPLAMLAQRRATLALSASVLMRLEFFAAGALGSDLLLHSIWAIEMVVAIALWRAAYEGKPPPPEAEHAMA